MVVEQANAVSIFFGCSTTVDTLDHWNFHRNQGNNTPQLRPCLRSKGFSLLDFLMTNAVECMVLACGGLLSRLNRSH